jgi:Na+/citrate or Na+/malate symporter
MNIINFFIKSSADPRKISLTVKGALGMFTSLIVFSTGIADTDINTIIDATAVVVQNVVFLVSSVVTLYGLLRKGYYAFKTSKMAPYSDLIDEDRQSITSSNSNE